MKYHNALAYHHVCGAIAAIAAKVLHFIQMPGTQNPAGVLTKFLPHYVLGPLVEPFLFWKGETDVSNACVEGGITIQTTITDSGKK